MNSSHYFHQNLLKATQLNMNIKGKGRNDNVSKKYMNNVNEAIHHKVISNKEKKETHSYRSNKKMAYKKQTLLCPLLFPCK